jgi:hypothetical protein
MRGDPGARAAAIAVLIVIGGFAWHQYRETVRVRAVAENTTHAQGLKDDIDRCFPGSSDPLGPY